MKIYGNKRALERLSDYAKNNRFPHSLLLYGDSGTGKKTLADYIAMLLFCSGRQSEPCMSCHNCDRIEKHIHPDVIYSNCGGILIEDMRGILKTTFEKSVEDGIRVYIFTEFQLLNRECQNSLLTYLEEPSPNIRFILTSSNKNGILPTVLSRTASIQTQKLSEEECRDALTEKGFAGSAADELAKTYGGNLGLALKAASDKNASLYLDLTKEFCEYIIEQNEYKALNLILHLPQPKEDKREPIRILVTETEKIFHDGFAMASGGKASCGCCRELSKKAASAFSLSSLNRLCAQASAFSKTVAENNFNAKITANAFVASLFSAVQ